MREKKEFNIKIGRQIKNAREAAGLTQEKFSELVGLAPKNVSDIERGVVGISLSALTRICEVLSITSDSILFENRGEHANSNSTHTLITRLEQLSPEQHEIAMSMINKLFEAFALSSKK